MTGDGRPFVVMHECQSTGGYPRIGTVVPSDLPTIAQAGLNPAITFLFNSSSFFDKYAMDPIVSGNKTKR